MTDYESWYQQQIEEGRLPDKEGRYHYSLPRQHKELFLELIDELCEKE